MGKKINGVDVEKLVGIVNAVKQNPEAGKTLWQASCKWKGGFAEEVKIREHSFKMDEPEHLGGSNTAPNMVEYVLGAYGSCLMVGYAMNAAVRGIEIKKMDIDLEGEIDLHGFIGLADPEKNPPSFSWIKAKVNIEAPGATEKQLKELHEVVVKTSPVGNILRRPMNVQTELALHRAA